MKQNQNKFKGYIYKATNIKNNKCYIGKTSSNIYEYINHHLFLAEKNEDKCNKYFYNAIRKYGKEEFKWEILGELEATSREDLTMKLNEAEIECIHFFRSYGSNGKTFDSIYGYNMTKGGDGGNTWSGLSENKRKESSNKLKKSSRKGALKRYEDPKEKVKTSKSIKKAFKEKPECIEKIKIASKKKYENPEERKKTSESIKKAYKDPVKKQNSRNGAKKRNENPEYSKNLSNSLKEVNKNPIVRKRKSKSSLEKFKINIYYIIYLNNVGYSIEDIALIMNISVKKVKRRLSNPLYYIESYRKSYYIKSNTSRYINIDLKKLYNLFKLNNYSLKELALYFNVSIVTIKRRLKEIDLL